MRPSRHFSTGAEFSVFSPYPEEDSRPMEFRPGNKTDPSLMRSPYEITTGDLKGDR